MKKILISPDSFKDCLSAFEVAKHIEKGLLSRNKDIQCRIIPVADGGEGTLDVIIKATKGEMVPIKVHDPLFRPIDSKYGVCGDGKTAVIEMATASGIEILSKEERNPWITTTFGTGELIKDALAHGCRKFIIAIGGSATNDGGAGMAEALGVRFLDKHRQNIKHGGGFLGEIETIDISSIDTRIFESEFLVACDVRNSLVGSEGASYVYGLQKGADNSMVHNLDKNLQHYASKIKMQLKKDIAEVPGAGAAGGLGAGLMAFLNARLKSGFEIVQEAVNLHEHCKWADIVITGEGKIDEQTQFGKTPQGVANIARKYNKNVIAVAGTLGEGYEKLYNSGFDSIWPITNKPMSLEESIQNAPMLLEHFGMAVSGMV
ncbi:MAG: glycerate kinase [Bacteroidales bacterium]|nr:glycerate kinase [Bacteroidales bacterium]MBN2820342.1 glycerate kinase [Bacteroidales bacterium]